MARLAVTLSLVGALVAPGLGRAAEPASGTISQEQRSTEWRGGPFSSSTQSCSGSGDSSCDHFYLTIEAPNEPDYWVYIRTMSQLVPYGPNDIDFTVHDATGAQVAESDNDYPYELNDWEYVYLNRLPPGTYEVRVRPSLVVSGAEYEGYAALSWYSEPPPPPEPSDLDWTPDPGRTSIEVPLRIVMVGFTPNEIDETRVIADVPDSQKPGVLLLSYNQQATECEPRDPRHPYYPYWPLIGCTGLETLVNHGRAYYGEDDNPYSLLPIEFRWKPEVVYASSDFTSGLFSHMRSNSTLGYHARSATDDYLDHYNLTRGQFRGPGREVQPQSMTRLIDAEAAEDWIAQNSLSKLGFETGRTPGVPGYTVFFMNTYDSPEAAQVFEPNEYHHFLINRTDPDTGVFAGIDWGRVWGGRYRFAMVDLGAAPNPYESETWGNRNRSGLGSAAYDPPLWEYRANAPRPVTPVHAAGAPNRVITPGARWDLDQLNRDLARTVTEAASFLFFRSYLYPPEPQTGSYWLSATMWHDKFAEQPFASDMLKLYDQEEVMTGLETLVPYFSFKGDVDYRYLAEDKPGYAFDQEALQSAKYMGGYTYMDVDAAIEYIEANRERFYRAPDCYTNVPVLNVVVEKHFAWALPVIVAGIAPSYNGRPWGSLASVNDLTKSKVADKDETMALAHPQIYNIAFSYTTVHEVSHYLGLSHPHDTIGASRDEDGVTRYWDGFTWTFNSTAAPTTYSHVEMSYNVLDQESIARGHTSYYLTWSDYALSYGGNLFKQRGYTSIVSLPQEAQDARASAVEAIGRSEQLFSEFRFVDAALTAQEAWRSAAAYQDFALEQPLGSTEIAFGTKHAASCPS